MAYKSCRHAVGGGRSWKGSPEESGFGHWNVLAWIIRANAAPIVLWPPVGMEGQSLLDCPRRKMGRPTGLLLASRPTPTSWKVSGSPFVTLCQIQQLLDPELDSPS